LIQLLKSLFFLITFLLLQEAKSQVFYSFIPNQGVKYQMLGNQNFTSKNNSALDFANNAALVNNDSTLKFSFSAKRTSNINLYSFATVKSLKRGSVYIALQSIPFGKIDEYASNGLNTGFFSASINSLSAGYGYKVGLFSMGVSSRLNIASIQNYQNLHLGLDFNGMYENTKKGIGIGWNIQNISIINQQNLKQFSIRPNVSIGGSIRPKYIPIQVHLSIFDLIEKKYKNNFALGLEILENKPFNLFLGYNNAAINKLRVGFRFIKSKYSFLMGTEIGPVNTQYYEMNYLIKRK
jgi:hypothetical protein